MNGTTVQAISTVVLSWKLAGLRALRLAVLEDRIEHHAEHGEEDHQADDQHEVVQPLHVGGDLADAGGCRSNWLTAGPPARSLHRPARRTRQRGAERPGRAGPTRRPECSERHHRCATCSRLLRVVSASAPSACTLAGAAPQRNSSASGAAQLRAARTGRPRCAGPRPRARSASRRDARARPGPRPARNRPARSRRPRCRRPQARRAAAIMLSLSAAWRA